MGGGLAEGGRLSWTGASSEGFASWVAGVAASAACSPCTARTAHASRTKRALFSPERTAARSGAGRREPGSRGRSNLGGSIRAQHRSRCRPGLCLSDDSGLGGRFGRDVVLPERRHRRRRGGRALDARDDRRLLGGVLLDLDSTSAGQEVGLSGRGDDPGRLRLGHACRLVSDDHAGLLVSVSARDRVRRTRRRLRNLCLRNLCPRPWFRGCRRAAEGAKDPASSGRRKARRFCGCARHLRCVRLWRGGAPEQGPRDPPQETGRPRGRQNLRFPLDRRRLALAPPNHRPNRDLRRGNDAADRQRLGRRPDHLRGLCLGVTRRLRRTVVRRRGRIPRRRWNRGPGPASRSRSTATCPGSVGASTLGAARSSSLAASVGCRACGAGVRESLNGLNSSNRRGSTGGGAGRVAGQASRGTRVAPPPAARLA